MHIFKPLDTILKIGRSIVPNKTSLRCQFPSSCSFTRCISFNIDGLKKTALYPAHVQMHGKMIDWAGYALPMQYNEDIFESHLHVRQNAGLFDLSHFGQFLIHGDDRISFLESLIVGDLQLLNENEACYSLLTNENAGILGDCVVVNKLGFLYMIVSPECKSANLEYMQSKLEVWEQKNESNVIIEDIENRSLISLQGPKAAEVLNELVNYNLFKMDLMHSIEAKIEDIDCWICRCGSTGEDGFEISVENEHALHILNLILNNDYAKPQGLVVRDTLRLEAGMCLYYRDIDETITPNEAELLWTVGKRRLEEGGFPGHDIVVEQIKGKVQQKRVGLLIEKGNPVKANSEIFSENGDKIGHVTSSTFSPSLQKKIAMGYVEKEYSKIDTKIAVKNNKVKLTPARIVKMPFVPKLSCYMQLDVDPAPTIPNAPG